MNSFPILRFSFFASALLVSSCATANKNKLVGHALYVCKALTGPDAHKANGEVGYWFESERSQISRRLWSPRGIKAIEQRISSTTNVDELQCLEQLRREALTHQFIYK